MYGSLGMYGVSHIFASMSSKKLKENMRGGRGPSWSGFATCQYIPTEVLDTLLESSLDDLRDDSLIMPKIKNLSNTAG